MKGSFGSIWGRVAWLGLLASACTGQEVSVGGEGFDQCVGVEDGCSASVKGKEADNPTPVTCPETTVGNLLTAFTFKWTYEICGPIQADCGKDEQGRQKICPPDPTKSCSTTLKSFALAPDGSIWLAATASGQTAAGKPTQALWLGHIGGDGTNLGFSKIASGTALRDNTTYYEASISVDAESRAYVAINSNDPGPNADAEIRDHTWLQQYDTSGDAIDGAWDLPGMARTLVALHDDGRIALAANAANLEQRAIAAVLEADSQLLWSQPKVPSTGARTIGLIGLGTDASGNVFVYTHRGDNKARIVATVGVVMFDADGKRLWDRTVPGGFAGAVGYGDGTFGVDAAGNVTMVGNIPSDVANAPPAWDKPVRVVSMDKRGNTRWVAEVDGGGTSLAVERSTGTVYVGGAYRSTETGDLSVARISQDGVCERLAAPSALPGSVVPGPDGSLYFIGQWELGRFKPLDP